MKLAELIRVAREEADDLARPYLWDDSFIAAQLNEAEREAAERANLLLDMRTGGVARLTYRAGRDYVPLDPKVYQVLHAQIQGERSTLDRVEPEELDESRPHWDEEPPGRPRAWHVTNNNELGLYPKPQTDVLLYLRVFRLPLRDMTQDEHKPEIHERWHRYLVDWALYRMFSRRDSEEEDQARAGGYFAAFEARFGYKHSADAQRKRAGNRRAPVTRFREF